MRPLSAAVLMEAWDAPAPEGVHVRLERLLSVALDGADISGDTLGRRNQRLIALRRSLGMLRPIEAKGRCGCGVDNEVIIPADAIEAAPTPPTGAVVSVEVDGRTLLARLPTMADLASVASMTDPAAAGAALVRRCLDPANDDAVNSETVLLALGSAFEAVDPAADIRLAVTCAGCGEPLRVAVDLANFIGRDVAAQLAGLTGEIDALARAYGWSEADILALPPVRRRRYVAMVRGEMLGDVA